MTTRSTSVIWPPATVIATTAIDPAVAHDDHARRAVDDRRPPETRRTRAAASRDRSATSRAPCSSGGGAAAGASRPRSAPEDDVGVEHRERAPRSRRRARRRGTRRRPRAAGPTAARRLGSRAPRTRRRARLASWRVAGDAALDDRRDLLERDAEHVVQHEREPLGGRQRLEHDEQREPDRVGEQRLAARGRWLASSVHDRLRAASCRRAPRGGPGARGACRGRSG